MKSFFPPRWPRFLEHFVLQLTVLALIGGSAHAETKATACSQASPPRPQTMRQIAESSRPAISHPLNHSDRHFLERAIKAGMTEVRMSELAGQRAVNPHVRLFAEQLASDLGKMNSALKALAERKGFVLPDWSSDDRELDRISRHTDLDFDRQYVGHIVDDHEDAIERCERAARSGDPDIAAFAVSSFPGLKKQLIEAREIERSLRP